MTTITFVVPIRTSNPLNGSHQHWSAKARKRKAERAAVARVVAETLVFDGAGSATWARQELEAMAAAGPVSVRLIRTKPRGGPLDFDGLTAALKSVRDGVALALGIDDGDTARVRFDYAEERGEWGVRVEVSATEAAHSCLRCENAKHMGKALTDRQHCAGKNAWCRCACGAEARILAGALERGVHIPAENLRAFVEDIAQRADRANAKRAGAKVQPTPATYRPRAR